MKAVNFVTCAVIAIAAFGTGIASAANAFKVAAEISEHGTTIASPALVVKSGSPGSVEVIGEKGYRFIVQVDPAKDGTINVVARAETPTGKVDSTLNGNLDVPMTISTGDIGLKVTVTQAGG